MKSALFARTENLRDVVARLRAHDTPVAEMLEAQLTERVVNVVGGGNRRQSEAAAGAARVYIAGLAGPDGGPALQNLWDAIESIESADCGDAGQRPAGQRPAGNERAIERAMKRSLDDLRMRDPAAHARIVRLLGGEFNPRRDRSVDEQAPRGARGVLARTGGEPRDQRAANREEGRELLRWRDILGSLLPEECRPARRIMVPGGVACADLDGPRLSWEAIAGTSTPEARGAFEVHLLSCDHCFEFHYRARRALRVLHERKASVVGAPPASRSVTPNRRLGALLLRFALRAKAVLPHR